MSVIPKTHDHVVDGVDSHTANPTHTRDAKESIMLHQLCDHCKSFIDDWDLLDRVQEGLDVYSNYTSWSRHLVHFSTIAQLLQSKDLCHMCAMVLSKLDYHGMEPDLPVHLSVNGERVGDGEEPGYLPLLLGLGDYQWVGYQWASLYLKCFNASNNDAFNAPERKQSVPAQPTANLDQIKTWLDACIRTHKSCSAWSSKLTTLLQRPTRILELTPDGVRLRCDSNTIEDLQYLTLSHVWGDSPHRLRLIRSRLQEFQNAVPWEELPAIFKEALRIVRHIGFHYLWVDVLCIIQDSPSDWKAEAAAMTGVYSNAICSISFLFPPGKVLFQTREDPRTMSPCIIRKADQTREGVYIVASPGQMVPGSRAPGTFTSRFNYHTWPIFKRAWTFQEHLLSPRTVFYGHQSIMWECAEDHCDELAGSWLPKTETRFYNRDEGYRGRKITQKLHLSSSAIAHEDGAAIRFADYKHRRDDLKSWKDLIWEYSARNLTVPSDRPIAFAGVARAFQANEKLTYLAGIWAESLPDGLLWYVDVKPGWQTEQRVPISYSMRETGSQMAPSWSWLSCPLYSAHNFNFYDNYEGLKGFDTPSQPHEVIFLAQFVHFQWSGWPLNQMPPSAFHDFFGLQITLEVATYEATTFRSELGYGIDCLCLMEKLASCDNQGLRVDEEHVLASLRCDDIRYHVRPPEKALLALLVEFHDTPWKRLFAGLALMPGTEEGTWKRFGYWSAEIFCKLYYRSVWKKKDPSVFLRLEGVRMQTLTLV